MNPLLDLLDTLGLTVKSDINVAKGMQHNYTRDKAIKEIVNIKFLSEPLAIHGPYIDNVTGSLKSCYLKVVDVLKPEVDAISNDSEDDTNVCISDCAGTVTKRVQELYRV